jgi:hypothetical protein
VVRTAAGFVRAALAAQEEAAAASPGIG